MEIDDDDAPHGAVDLLYSFMHPSSLVSKYKERYGLNGLQATAAAPSCIPTKDRRSSTPRYYSHSMCKRVFRVKLSVSSIHLWIHHHLYPNNTEKDMDRMVSTRLLLLLQLLLVAYHQPIVVVVVVVTGIPSNNNTINIHRTDANASSTWSCLSPLFIYEFIITCIQIQRKIWTEWSPGYYSSRRCSL